MSWEVILFVVLLVATLGSLALLRSARSWNYPLSAALLIATILVGLKVFRVIH